MTDTDSTGSDDNQETLKLLEALTKEQSRVNDQLKALKLDMEKKKSGPSTSETNEPSEEQDAGDDDKSSVSSIDLVVKSSVSKNDSGEVVETSDAKTAHRSTEADQLREELRSRKPPKLELTLPVRVTQADLRKENSIRNRLPPRNLMFQVSEATGKILSMVDDPKSEVAPSVMVKPLPLTQFPSFNVVMKQMGFSDATTGAPLYLADCRVFSERAFKDLVLQRAQHLVVKMEAKMVDRGTQTYVSQVRKQYAAGCVNCRSGEHYFRACSLPYRQGFCHVCGADGFDEEDCIFPHGIEHEYALERCAGCARDLSLYCPECPDCNIRSEGISDWLRLNYVTWPTWAIPKDHQYLVGEGEEVLKRKVKAKFDSPQDYPNRIRQFLIRENALAAVKQPANPKAPNATKLAEEKRQRAIQALYTPLVRRTLDKIMKERPEIRDEDEVEVVIPTRFKKPSK